MDRKESLALRQPGEGQQYINQLGSQSRYSLPVMLLQSSRFVKNLIS